MASMMYSNYIIHLSKKYLNETEPLLQQNIPDVKIKVLPKLKKTKIKKICVHVNAAFHLILLCP